jgi:hypothetical protein
MGSALLDKSGILVDFQTSQSVAIASLNSKIIYPGTALIKKGIISIYLEFLLLLKAFISGN